MAARGFEDGRGVRRIIYRGAVKDRLGRRGMGDGDVEMSLRVKQYTTFSDWKRLAVKNRQLKFN